MTTGSAERDLLLAQLTGHRRHALSAVEGLAEETLTRPAVPSGWTFLGMIRHLTLDEERFWFRAVMAGEEEAIAFFGGDPDTWTPEDGQSPADVVAGYRVEIERADAIIAATDLDAAPAWWPGELFGSWRLGSLREVLLHMISEVACHAGQLDVARELVDGHQFLVLDGGRATGDRGAAG